MPQHRALLVAQRVAQQVLADRRTLMLLFGVPVLITLVLGLVLRSGTDTFTRLPTRKKLCERSGLRGGESRTSRSTRGYWCCWDSPFYSHSWEPSGYNSTPSSSPRRLPYL